MVHSYSIYTITKAETAKAVLLLDIEMCSISNPLLNPFTLKTSLAYWSRGRNCHDLPSALLQWNPSEATHQTVAARYPAIIPNNPPALHSVRTATTLCTQIIININN